MKWTVSDIYLDGSRLLGGLAETPPSARSAAETVADDAERAVHEVEDEERRALRPFEASDPPATSLGCVLPTEIRGVPDAAWTRFVLALKTAQPGAVSASNAYGMFEMKPRRLADLGLMKNLRKTRLPPPVDRLIWVGEFVPPLTQKKFLADLSAQYRALSDSVRKYVEGLRDGTIPRLQDPPGEMTLSGALAVLHRSGPRGLRTWEEAERFGDTVAVYERANGIF